MSSIQNRLQELMSSRKLKQVDILNLSKPYQKALNITLSKSHLSQYVNGKSQPDQYKLLLLANTLQVNPAWLLGYDTDTEIVDEIYQITLQLEEERQEKVRTFATNEHKDQSLSSLVAEINEDTALYPVNTVEGVAAGVGFSYEDMNRTESYYTDRTDLKAYSFATRVFGDSMADLIQDGDIVLIQQGYDNQSGGIYAVDYDGKSFLKKVYLKDNQFIMSSINPKYEDIVIDLPIPEDTYLNIIGKVVDWFTPKTIY